MHGLADRLHVRIGSDALRWFGALLAAITVLALGPALQGPAASKAGRIGSPELLTAQGWLPVDLHALKLPRHKVSVLRARVVLAPWAVASGRPLGLYLSGAFSADAQWNGSPIGEKGRPGSSASTEVPGPIDAVLPLSSLRPGQNMLTLRLSAERLTAAHSVIHGQGAIFGFRVAPFSADARRPIGYYVAPLLVAVAALAALVALASREAVRRPAATILTGLLVCALAELARSIVDYSYPLQAFRLGVLKVGAAAIFLGCVWTAIDGARWRTPPYLRSFGLVGIGLIAVVLPTDGAALIVAGGGVAGLIAALGAIRQRDGRLIQQAAAFLFLASLSAAPNLDYMDQGLYVACIPLIAQFLRHTRTPEWLVSETPSAPQALVIGPIGARRFLDLRTIQALHAAGDYVEISAEGGRRFLEAQTLGTLADQLPAAFLRVHRSHIVNLALVQELRSDGGGRYRIRLGESLWVPVSRTRISEVRARLSC